MSSLPSIPSQMIPIKPSDYTALKQTIKSDGIDQAIVEKDGEYFLLHNVPEDTIDTIEASLKSGTALQTLSFDGQDLSGYTVIETFDEINSAKEGAMAPIKFGETMIDVSMDAMVKPGLLTWAGGTLLGSKAAITVGSIFMVYGLATAGVAAVGTAATSGGMAIYGSLNEPEPEKVENFFKNR